MASVEAQQKNGEKRREFGMKMRQKTVLLSLSLAAALAVSGCGGKKAESKSIDGSAAAQSEASSAGSGEETKASDGGSASGGTTAASKASEEDSKFPTEVRAAFTEVRDVNYDEKKSSAKKPEGEVLTLTSGPITAELPAKGFQRSNDPEQANYEVWAVTEDGQGRAATITLDVTAGQGPGVRRGADRVRSLEIGYSYQDYTDMKAKVINVGKQKWLRLSYRSDRGKEKSRVVRDFVDYIGFLANREVVLRFEYGTTAEEYRGRTESPFTEELMEQMVKSIATVPVKEYNPAGIDLNPYVDKANVKPNTVTGVEEFMQPVPLSLDAGELKKMRKGVRVLGDAYLQKMKELDLSAVDDCSSFSGETVVLHGNEDNESISIRLPVQFNSSQNGPLYHRHLNVADYNTESYIEVTTEVNSGNALERSIFSANAYISQFVEAEQVGVQIYGDKPFFVTLQLDKSTEPFGKLLKKKAILCVHNTLVTVEFVGRGEELTSFTEGEIEVLKSLAVNGTGE